MYLQRRPGKSERPTRQIHPSPKGSPWEECAPISGRGAPLAVTVAGSSMFVVKLSEASTFCERSRSVSSAGFTLRLRADGERRPSAQGDVVVLLGAAVHQQVSVRAQSRTEHCRASPGSPLDKVGVTLLFCWQAPQPDTCQSERSERSRGLSFAGFTLRLRAEGERRPSAQGDVVVPLGGSVHQQVSARPQSRTEHCITPPSEG